jgi:dTDP-glucose pyrophosphorylase
VTDWRKTLIGPETRIIDAIRAINANSMQVALVVDAEQRLLGIVTDGDIRLGLLRNESLDCSIGSIMNRSPKTVNESCHPATAMNIMRNEHVRHLPVVDDHQKVVGLMFWDQLTQPQRIETWVVLMAGGFGSRLRPLTEQCPKPMLKVGDRPLLEHILVSLISQGFGKFFISVNYLSHIIEDHFGDGSQWGVDIRYLREREQLGTAGALGLLPERPTKPLLVMNGDLLTAVDFRNILRFHAEFKAVGTMCVRDNEYTIPYGVAELHDHRIVRIREKPAFRHSINAGIYVLEPEVLDSFTAGSSVGMPDLFNMLIESGKNVVAFPIQEYWIDIGRVAELERANAEFETVFQAGNGGGILDGNSV